MSFTNEDVLKTVQLVLAGGPNIDIAKQLYVNFISSNSQLKKVFWDEYFKKWDLLEGYEYTTEFNEFFDNVVCNSFGTYGIDGLEYITERFGGLFGKLNWLQINKNTIREKIGVPKDTQVNWHIFGMNIWHRISGEEGYGFHNVSNYEFILKGTVSNGRYPQYTASVMFTQTHGSCGSGYCAASWGNVEIKKATAIHLNPHYLPTEHIPVELISIGDCDYLLSNTGNLIYSDGVGGDAYYPSGGIHIGEHLMQFFTPVAPERLVDKPNVYFFTGESALGKSYLANMMHNNLYVYETDSLHIDESRELSYRLSSMLCADVVVIGGKNKSITLDTVVDAYQDLLKREGVDANIIICNFSKQKP